MYMISKYFLIKKIKGFTLVEMIVVLGLFSFLMTLATGVLYSTQAISVKLQETQAILDNVNLSMDTMAREIRYGSNFHCTNTLNNSSSSLRKNCLFESGGGKIIIFRPNNSATSSDRVAYYSSSTSYGNVILKDEYTESGTSTYQITANDVKINSLVFYVDGANSMGTSTGENADDVHDYIQPFIIVTISGETRPLSIRASSTKFSIEASLSARELDK